MIQTLGGEIARGRAREYGKAILEIAEPGELFVGVSPKTQVWMSHGDKVARMPEGGFRVLGSSGNTEFCAVMDYFEIFLERMLLCRRAAEFLELTFKLDINGLSLL